MTIGKTRLTLQTILRTPFHSFNSDVIENIIAAKPNYVEIFLNGLKRIIEAEKNKDFTEQV